MMPNLAYFAIGCFVAAAFFGLIVFIQLACGKPSLKPAVAIHGILALTGLGLLITYLMTHQESGPLISAIVLGLAALGGLTLLSFDLRQKALPKMVLFLHPLIALIGLGLLIGYILF